MKPEPLDGTLLHAPEAERLAAAAAADAAAPRQEFLVAPPLCLHKRLASLLEDPRDLPILFLYLNVLLTTGPAAAALFWGFPAASRPLAHWLGAAYLILNYAAYLARFMLSLHYSQHRRLFKRGGGAGKERRAGLPLGHNLLMGRCGMQPGRQPAAVSASQPAPATSLASCCRPMAAQPGRPPAAGAAVWHPIW
jgi:hypothetical protein